MVGEGYASSFRKLIEETNWKKYGTGINPKCADCMVHSGYEATAVNDTFSNPLKALKVFLRGPRTDGAMAPEVPFFYKDDTTTTPRLVAETETASSCSKKRVA